MLGPGPMIARLIGPPTEAYSSSPGAAGTPLPAHTALTFVLNSAPIEEPDFRNSSDVILETHSLTFTTGDGN